jgi:DNA-directed RNA polymerases I, II, and III subunit RPABC1
MNFLSRVYQSRKIILEMLELRNFDIDKYNNFTINEIDIMVRNTPKKINPEMNPLDIIVHNKYNTNKVIVKYIIFTKIRPQNLKLLIDDMLDEVNENDTIIFINKDKLNNVNQFENVFNSYKNIFIQIFDLNNLLINISKHILVPKLRILSEDEKNHLLIKFNIINFNDFPIIKNSDPQAKFYGVKRYDMCEIIRPSETSGLYKSWRYCL